MGNAAKVLSLEEAKKVIEYCPETGVLRWRITDRAKSAGAIAGTKKPSGYVDIKLYGKIYKAHRLAWFLSFGIWPRFQIDHINRIRDDNRLKNLRDVTCSQNAQNRAIKRADGSPVGASWHAKSMAWQASIRVGGKIRYLGLFGTKEAAGDAYLSAKAKWHYPV